MNVSQFLLWCCLLGLTAGCQTFSLQQLDFSQFDLRSQNPEEDEAGEDEADPFETTLETPMLGEYTIVAGTNLIVLQGVGLVTGLDGTGEDPQTSHYRTSLLDDMRRHGVKNPNQILARPDTALVIVRAYLPPLVRKGDAFDVEVRLPEGSKAISLNGGWLMETYLSEQAVVPGRGVLEGHVFARAKGPIMIAPGTAEDDATRVGLLQRGRVLGGGVSTTERDLAMYLRNDFRMGRNSERVADRIGDRFHHYNRHGIREPLAEAKTDQKVELKIMPKYRDNYPRYLNVIRNIAFRESPVAQRVRMQRLQEKLNVPETSELASLQLEAIGHEAAPVLKTGLKNPDLEVRFHAAMALAYLGEPDGLADLAEAVRREPAFRVFALAGMAAIDEAESHVLLRELLHEQSAETRYGAFRALTTLDKNDPFVRGEDMHGQFMLHVLPTRGEPMVHLTTHKKAEIVLFGAEQEFRPPLALRAGRHILITAAPGGDTVTISRFEVGRPQRKKTISLQVAEVIRTVSEFGATYPDVAGMLAQADQQHNLSGRIEIDALPRSGRVYYRGANRARIGSPRTVPNLYSTDAPDEGESGDLDADQSEETDAALDEGTASVIDLRDGDDGKSDAASPSKPEAAADSETEWADEPADAEPADAEPADAEIPEDEE